MSVLRSIWGAIAAAAVIALGIFAYGRARSAAGSAKKARERANKLEANVDRVEGAAAKAGVKRLEAQAHAAKAEAIKARARTRLWELEDKRGSRTAAAIADRLSSL